MTIKIKIKNKSGIDEKEVLSTWTPENDDYYESLEVLTDEKNKSAFGKEPKTKPQKPIKTSSEVRAAFSDVPMDYVPPKKPKSPSKPTPTTPTEPTKPTTPATTPPKKKKEPKK